MSLTRTENGVEPVTLAEAKQQCYIPTTDTDSTLEALLNSFITGARRYGENRTWRTLVDSEWVWKFDKFPPGIIELAPKTTPLVSVDSVQYIDGDGNTQTVSTDDYRVDTDSEPGRIEPVDDWPAPDDRVNAVIITVSSGYADSGGASTVPEDIKIALRMHIKYLYDNRDSFVFSERSSGEYHEAPVGTNALLDQYSMRTP